MTQACRIGVGVDVGAAVDIVPSFVAKMASFHSTDMEEIPSQKRVRL